MFYVRLKVQPECKVSSLCPRAVGELIHNLQLEVPEGKSSVYSEGFDPFPQILLFIILIRSASGEVFRL